ncbi:uncharacterized protein V6R79_002413 [Siganus canaliculatus]
MSRSTGWIPRLWLDVFDELQYDDNELDYGHDWNLNFNYTQTDEVTPKQRRKGWKIHRHHVYGHFQCTSCRNAWSSARAVLLFRYKLQGNQGTVIMRPFAQACRSCPHNYQLPGFSREEVERALRKLFLKIRKNCYGEEVEIETTSSFRKMKKPHESSLCEACKSGICSEGDA